MSDNSLPREDIQSLFDAATTHFPPAGGAAPGPLK